MSGQIGDEKKQLFRIQISRGHHWLNNGKDFEECLMWRVRVFGVVIKSGRISNNENPWKEFCYLECSHYNMQDMLVHYVTWSKTSRGDDKSVMN